jgi:hypothetical protein
LNGVADVSLVRTSIELLVMDPRDLEGWMVVNFG